MEISIQSKFAKVGVDIKDGDFCTIRSEGELVPAPKDKTKMIYNFELELMDGNTKITTFNNASIRNLLEAFGKDSKNWNGKSIVATVTKIQAFGEQKDSAVWDSAEDKESEDIEVV